MLIGWAYSSAWIEWLPAEQLVEGSSPSGPVAILIQVRGYYKENIPTELR